MNQTYLSEFNFKFTGFNDQISYLSRGAQVDAEVAFLMRTWDADFEARRWTRARVHSSPQFMSLW